jgi:hypothetical protein
MVSSTVGADQRVLVLTLKLLALKKPVFSPVKNPSHFFLTFVYLYSMQLFSADPTIFSKNFLINFLPMKTLKNRPQKLLIIGPNLFFTVQPSPQPKIDILYYKYVPRCICLLICGIKDFIYSITNFIHT